MLDDNLMEILTGTQPSVMWQWPRWPFIVLLPDTRLLTVWSMIMMVLVMIIVLTMLMMIVRDVHDDDPDDQP